MGTHQVRLYVVSTIILSLGFLTLTACAQLPSRKDGIKTDDIPDLDPTLIPSSNGLLSAGINTVPGSYCLAGNDGKCDPAKLSPAQCITNGATVEVAPKTNPTPSYDSLIDHKYSGAANVPFISATMSAEYYDEVKATVAGTAQFAPASPNNGYPGIDGLKACILHNQGPGTYGVVFWISAANIFDVTVQHFQQVSSTDGVTATAFGLNGSTYDHSGLTQERIWIGIQASPIQVGTISERPAQPIPKVTSLPHGLAVQSKSPVEALPQQVKMTILSVTPSQ